MPSGSPLPTRFPSDSYAGNRVNDALAYLASAIRNLGDQAVNFLERAQAKEPLNPKVISAREIYQRVGRKYGISTTPKTEGRNAEKKE